jgi:hypothetical protein
VKVAEIILTALDLKTTNTVLLMVNVLTVSSVQIAQVKKFLCVDQTKDSHVKNVI